MGKILSLKKLRFDHEKSLTPALSKPGLSALFWSTVLSGAQIFLAHFCAQNLRPQYGRCSLTCWIFAPKKTEKGGISATRLDQPAGPSALSTVVPGRETFFRNLTRRRTE